LREESTLPTKIKNSLHEQTPPVKQNQGKYPLLLLANSRPGTASGASSVVIAAPPPAVSSRAPEGSLISVFSLAGPAEFPYTEGRAIRPAGPWERPIHRGPSLDPVPHEWLESGGYDDVYVAEGTG
jgi:hypothetical protein